MSGNCIMFTRTFRLLGKQRTSALSLTHVIIKAFNKAKPRCSASPEAWPSICCEKTRLGSVGQVFHVLVGSGGVISAQYSQNHLEGEEHDGVVGDHPEQLRKQTCRKWGLTSAELLEFTVHTNI